MLELIKKFPESVEKASKLELSNLKNLKKKKFENIVICGIGGSALPADILKDFLRDEIKIPIEIIRYPNLPVFVSDKSLVFIISYSGNTFETLSCFETAIKRKSTIIAITSSGRLLETAKKKKIPLIKVPKGLEPRFAIPYQFFPMLRILVKLKLIKNQDKIVREIIKTIKKNETKLESESKQIAQMLKNKIPIIYSSSSLKSAGYVWKIQLNETAKIPAFFNKIPEVFHNEICSFPLPENFKVILFIDEKNSRIRKQLEFFKTQLKNYYEVKINSSVKAKIFVLIYLGELVSYNLARLYGKEPRETKIITKIKNIK